MPDLPRQNGLYVVMLTAWEWRDEGSQGHYQRVIVRTEPRTTPAGWQRFLSHVIECERCHALPPGECCRTAALLRHIARRTHR